MFRVQDKKNYYYYYYISIDIFKYHAKNDAVSLYCLSSAFSSVAMME